jgi:hypothetical protein
MNSKGQSNSSIGLVHFFRPLYNCSRERTLLKNYTGLATSATAVLPLPNLLLKLSTAILKHTRRFRKLSGAMLKCLNCFRRLLMRLLKTLKVFRGCANSS